MTKFPSYALGQRAVKLSTELVGATESEGKGFSNGLFLNAATADSGQRTADSYAADGQRETGVQETVHSPQKIIIERQPDGSGIIRRQNGINLSVLADNHAADGFVYHSGVMGVPISFLDKYAPEQFEILDANDYRIGSKLLSKETAGVAHHITIMGQNVYRRVLIRRR